MESSTSAGHPALTDVRTGLPNALHWDTVFGVIFAAGDRGIPLTLILLAIDEPFKVFSGRPQAEVDGIMEKLGDALASTTRQSDLVARTHEERFSFVLLDCNIAGGRLVADRLDALLDPIREESGLSFSLGVASYNRDMHHAEDLVGAAEEALRAAQARGGDQTEYHD